MSSNLCPLCGEENICALANAEEDQCWCVNEEFPQGLLDLVPLENKRKRCICKKCLDNFKQVKD